MTGFNFFEASAARPQTSGVSATRAAYGLNSGTRRSRSQLIVEFGGFSRAAMIHACIYILGFVVAPFLPETRGQPPPA